MSEALLESCQIDCSPNHSVLCHNSPQCSSRMVAIIVKNDFTTIVAQGKSATDRHPLHHATQIAIEKVASLHQKVQQESSELDGTVLQEYKNDYLCTGYDCLLTQQPCVMCAMSLVHSRIKRVFYLNRDDHQIDRNCGECDDKAFTVHKLHILPNLNHHYEVWCLNKSDSMDKLHVIKNCDSQNENHPNKKLKI